MIAETGYASSVCKVTASWLDHQGSITFWGKHYSL